MENVIYPKMVMDALATVTYAGTKKNVVESGMVAHTCLLYTSDAADE